MTATVPTSSAFFPHMGFKPHCALLFAFVIFMAVIKLRKEEMVGKKGNPIFLWASFGKQI